MRKERFFLMGILAALVFTLVLAGCAEPEPPKVDDPKVTAQAITAGVLLSWEPIVEAEGYEIWRRIGKEPDLKIGYCGDSSSTSNVKKGGKAFTTIQFTDIASPTNDLQANTEYTYTVIAKAISNITDDGKWSKKVTTGAYPAFGSKPSGPKDVSYTYNAANNTLAITITPADSGILPVGYWFTVVRDGSWNSGDSTEGSITHDPANNVPFTWTVALNSNRFQNDYARDYYLIGVSTYINDDYYESNWYETKYEPDTKNISLINTWNASMGYDMPTSTTATTVPLYTQFTVYGSSGYPNISTGQSGVTYTFERAELNALGVEGTYTPVALTNSSSQPITLTTDIFGNPSANIVYDRGIQYAEKSYRYKVTAKKDGAVDQLSYREVTISFGNIATQAIYLDVDARSGANYAITPKFNAGPYETLVKSVLNSSSIEGIRVYWLVKSNSNDYNYGQYTEVNSIYFTKADLIASTKKDLTPVGLTATNYAWVQAYTIIGGEQTNNSININGSGINYTDWGNNNQEHHRLDY